VLAGLFVDGDDQRRVFLGHLPEHFNELGQILHVLCLDGNSHDGFRIVLEGFERGDFEKVSDRGTDNCVTETGDRSDVATNNRIDFNTLGSHEDPYLLEAVLFH